MKKMNRIGQIVKLRQFVKKWQTRAQVPHGQAGSTSSSTIGCSLSPRLKNASPFSYDSDQECCRRPASPPPDVPEGYLGVYVGRKGEDPTRFIIPTAYLSHPLFRTLLDKAEEEFGFDHQGGLTIPCEVSVFKQVLRVLGADDPARETQRLHDLCEFFSNERDCGSQAKALDSFPLYSFGFRNLMS